MKIIKFVLPFLLLIIVSAFAYKPLLHQGFFPIHDNTQIVRVNEMTSALKDGMFPVRWSKDLGYGYGYPIFNFYNPLPYYIGGVLEIITNNAIFVTKLLFILAIIFSACFSYLLGKEFFGKAGGIIMAIFYVYAPYHAVDIYIRGALAESFAYAFLPLLFYTSFKIYKNQNFWNLALFSLSFAFVICSHNLTALIISPFVIIFMIYLLLNSSNKSKLMIYFLASLGLGFALSAFYFIPAILEMNYTNVISQVGGGADFRDHFVCIQQLWTSPWGYGGSVKGCSDGLSFMIGKYHIFMVFIISIVAIFSLFLKRLSKIFEKNRFNLKIVLLFFLFFLLSTLMTLSVSKPMWEIFKPLAFVQYPWRFISLSLLFASFVIGALPVFVKPFINQKFINILIAFFLGFIILVNLKFFVPQKYLNVTNENYLNDYSVKWATSKISDEYMPKNFQKPKSYYEIPNSDNLITSEISAKFTQRKTQSLELNINVLKPGGFIFPIAYFPSWKAFLDSKNIPVLSSAKGIVINLPSGSHKLRFEYIQTPVEMISNLISLTGIISLIVGIILLRPKKT